MHWVLILLFFVFTSVEACVNPVLTAPPSIPPFVLIDDEGNRSGMAFTYAIHRLKPLFGKPKIKRATPPNRMVRELKAGEADINVFEMYNPLQESFAKYTEPWTYTQAGILTRSDTPLTWKGVTSLDKLRGGYYGGRPLPEPYGSYMMDNPNVITIPNPKSMIKMLKLGRVDYLFVLVTPITFDIQMTDGLKLKDFTFHKDSYVDIPVHMIVSKKSPCFTHFEKINDALKAQ